MITPTPNLATDLVYHADEALVRTRAGQMEAAREHRRQAMKLAALWRLESKQYDLNWTECIEDARRWLSDNPTEEQV